MVQKFAFSDYPPFAIQVYVDCDWAGCRKSRKSTSGGVILFEDVAVRAWSSNQAVIVSSSDEAEYYVALEGAPQALVFQSMLRGLGIQATITIYTDSSAARGIIHRAGLGKFRRLEISYLWFQAAVKAKRLQARKLLGTGNPADLSTNRLSAADMWRHLETLSITPEYGRTGAVPDI